MSRSDNNVTKEVMAEKSRASQGSQVQPHEDDEEAKKTEKSRCSNLQSQDTQTLYSELLGREKSRRKINYAELVEEKV
jgi:hypothetical protein